MRQSLSKLITSLFDKSNFYTLPYTKKICNVSSGIYQCIHSMTKLRLSFYSKDDGRVIVRLCAPMDYGPSRRAKNKDNRYHLWDYESDSRNHVLSLLPNQIVSMEFLNEHFNPAEFVTWSTDWFVKRNWGVYS